MSGDTLASYPYVRVRLACGKCTRRGSYRLARLAEKYGADIRMTDLLALLAGDCRLWAPRHPGLERCGAFFEDLVTAPLPPDLPRSLQKFQVIKGSKN
jgi:hypothetical protein